MYHNEDELNKELSELEDFVNGLKRDLNEDFSFKTNKQMYEKKVKEKRLNGVIDSIAHIRGFLDELNGVD